MLHLSCTVSCPHAVVNLICSDDSDSTSKYHVGTTLALVLAMALDAKRVQCFYAVVA